MCISSSVEVTNEYKKQKKRQVYLSVFSFLLYSQSGALLYLAQQNPMSFNLIYDKTPSLLERFFFLLYSQSGALLDLAQQNP